MVDSMKAGEEEAQIENKKHPKQFVDTRNIYYDAKLDDDLVTIKRVFNGWIVRTSNGPQGYAVDGDTLVFNDIDELCAALKVLYEEDE